MVANMQTTFAIFLSMEIVIYWFKHWSLFSMVRLIMSQKRFVYWLGAERATGYYLHQSWPSLSMHTCIWVTNPRRANVETPHYNDVKMGAMASQITGLTIVYSNFYSGADQRKHQSSVSLAFVRGIYLWPVNSAHKEPVTQKMFPFDDAIMSTPLLLIWFNFNPSIDKWLHQL